MSNSLTPMHKEQTFVFIKPDGVQRSIIGDVITRFERTGLKLVAIKMLTPDVERLTIHYGKSDEWYESKGQNTINNMAERGITPTKPAIEYGKDIVRSLLKFMSAGPAIAMIWEGNCAVDVVTKLVGSTEPKSSDIGTIRGDLTVDSYKMANLDGRAVRNLMHCSDSPQNAQDEINIWFKSEDISNYKNVNDIILYDVDWNHITE